MTSFKSQFKPQTLEEKKEKAYTTADIAQNATNLANKTRIENGEEPMTEFQKRQEALRQEMLMHGYNIEQRD